MKYSQNNQQRPPPSRRPIDKGQSSEEESESNSNQPQPQEIINREMEKIKHQLKNVSYELILKQMDTTSGGTVQNKNQGPTKKLGKKIKKGHLDIKEKEFKGEAIEVSIRQRPQNRQKVVFEPSRKKGIDPRFQSYAGSYNPDLAMKSFDFIPELQKAEISQLKAKLKNPKKRNKLNSHQKEVLAKEYNRLTNDFKRGELMQLQKTTKRQLKQQHGVDYHLGAKQLKTQFQKKKLQKMSQNERDKKIKQKVTQLQRKQLHDRHKALHFKPK